MESLGQIPMGQLSDRELLLLTYQQLHQMSENLENYKKTNDLQLHDIDKRMDALEKRMEKNDIIKAESDTRNAKMIKLLALGFTVVQIIIAITFFILNRK